MMTKQELDYIFAPKSVAVVGVSNKTEGIQLGGASFVNSLLSCGYKGNIYPINPKGGEFLGLKVYPDLKDVPEPVIDYVIYSTSTSYVLQTIKDCAVKGVKAIHIYTGGFSESGTEEGEQLERELLSLTSQNGLRIIGPNCVGIYCPKARLSFSPDFPQETGPVALISQSGSNAFCIVQEASQRGVRFSKVISFGNASDINESDLLEFLTNDEDTRIIAVYIEGVKDGRRFARVLKEAAKMKPVIVLKGGVGETGARAAASHTGVLAGSDEVWDGLLSQAGVIRVYSLGELVDMAVTFSCLPAPSGRRVAAICGGGGPTVLAADVCTHSSLTVPQLPPSVQNTLAGYLGKGTVGVNLSNPVDLSDQGWGIFYDCIKTLLNYDGIDLLIFQMASGTMPSVGTESSSVQVSALPTMAITDFINACQESKKPAVLAVLSAKTEGGWQIFTECERRCSEVGIPVYHSFSDAVKAITRFIDYHDLKSARE